MASGEDKMARLEELLRTLNGNQQSVNFTVTSSPTQTFQMFMGGSDGQHDWMEDVSNCFNSFVADERLVLRGTFPRGTGQRRSQVYTQEEEKDSIDIFHLSTFSETCCNSQLKKECI